MPTSPRTTWRAVAELRDERAVRERAQELHGEALRLLGKRAGKAAAAAADGAQRDDRRRAARGAHARRAAVADVPVRDTRRVRRGRRGRAEALVGADGESALM